jgi:hypothetical protein
MRREPRDSLESIRPLIALCLATWFLIGLVIWSW